MNRGFWDKLNKPIFALAPMANVTDAAFRKIISNYAKPDVTWTEFVSVDGLLSEGRDKLLVDLRFTEGERPIVAQIFGARPENFEKVAKILVEMGFDGIDINMGCPVKDIIKQSACADLIRNPKLAQEIIAATKRGAGNLPVSVKTRIGFGNVDETWIPTLLESKPAAITIHLRTVKEMSKVPAHWELMPQIVKMVQAVPAEDRPTLLGNGDVQSLDEAKIKVAETGCDGVMIGRGIFGNPWLFDRSKKLITISERMRAMLEHTRLFEQIYCGISAKGGSASGGKNFEVMKKHYKAYVNGFDGAKELRMKLMTAENADEIEGIILEHYPILKQKTPA
jgi:nifR3 family TIM-barrel protein